MMWMDFECEPPFVAEPPQPRQHFFPVVYDCPKGLLGPENFGKLFLSFFRQFVLGIQHLGSQNSGRMECRKALSMRAPKVTILLLFRVRNMVLKLR